MALEEEGFVRVTGDPADRRSCQISATREGANELGRFAEAGVGVFRAVIRDWSAEDVREFSRLITRLADDWMERGPARTRPPRRPASLRWRIGVRGTDQ